VSREQVPPSPTRAWQTPTGAQSKILPNTTNTCKNPTVTNPYLQSSKPHNLLMAILAGL